MDGNEQDGDTATLEHLSHNRCSTSGELLGPSERDQIGLGLVCGCENLFSTPPDPLLDADLPHAPGAVACDELLAPRTSLMLQLVGERGKRGRVVHVQDDDLHICVLRELDQCLRRERRRRSSLERNENAPQNSRPGRVGRNDDHGLQKRRDQLQSGGADRTAAQGQTTCPDDERNYVLVFSYLDEGWDGGSRQFPQLECA